jgi:hypothetical protein
LRHKRPVHNRSFRESPANRPSDRDDKPSISNIGLQLREDPLIVDQLATSIITMLTQLSRSRECPVRGHKPCKHWRDQFCGLTNRLSALVRQDFGIVHEIAM